MTEMTQIIAEKEGVDAFEEADPQGYRERPRELQGKVDLIDALSSVTFKDGFSMIKGDSCWIGSDSCEYDDPFDYLRNGSPVALEKL